MFKHCWWQEPILNGSVVALSLRNRQSPVPPSHMAVSQSPRRLVLVAKLDIKYFFYSYCIIACELNCGCTLWQHWNNYPYCICNVALAGNQGQLWIALYLCHHTYKSDPWPSVGRPFPCLMIVDIWLVTWLTFGLTFPEYICVVSKDHESTRNWTPH